MPELILVHRSLFEIKMLAVAQGKVERVFFSSWLKQDTVGDIYRAKVKRIVNSMQAAFVDIGTAKNALLPLSELQTNTADSKLKIADVLYESQPCLVQVTQAQRGEKGAVVSQKIRLHSPYLVYFPYQKGVGISKKIQAIDVRKELKQRLECLLSERKYEGGIIVRTAAQELDFSLLEVQIDKVIQQWKRIEQALQKRTQVGDSYRVQRLPEDVLRFWLKKDTRIVVDDKNLQRQISEYCQSEFPQWSIRVENYVKQPSLLQYYNVQAQLDALNESVIPLSSGAEIIIDYTRAMTVVDVNSGKRQLQQSQSEAILETNIEAAHEIARQIKLRNISGIIAIDFIDMASKSQQNLVRQALRSAFKKDDVQINIAGFSPFGVLEVVRQRRGLSWVENAMRICENCVGAGVNPSLQHMTDRLFHEINRIHQQSNANHYTILAHARVIDFIATHPHDLNQSLNAIIEKPIVFQAQEKFSLEQFEVKIN